MNTVALITAANPPAGPSPLQLPVMIAIMIAIFYILIIRPQQRREKERKSMINAIKKGQRVLFSGGIIGTVANVKDKSLTIKIAENVKVEVTRASVTGILEKGQDPSEIDDKA